MKIACQQMILMKYHTGIFLPFLSWDQWLVDFLENSDQTINIWKTGFNKKNKERFPFQIDLIYAH